MSSPVDQWRQIGPAYFDHCWNSVDRSHRQPILRALESLKPFWRVLEVGCNAGVNLRLIHQQWPEVELCGMDAHEAALAYARQRVPVQTFAGDLRDLLPAMRAQSFDVVLSCYCLAYIEPGQIADVLAHMRRIARVGLVIAEPMMSDQTTSIRYPAGIHECFHNYAQHFQGAECSQEHVLPNVERLNAVLTVRL